MSSAISGLVAASVIEWAYPGAFAAAVSLVVVGPVVAVLAGRLRGRLPSELATLRRRHRALAWLWLLAAAMAVIQTGRLATHMTDSESGFFLSTRNAVWAKHECMPAYVYGAELSERGEANIYDASHYPGLDPEAAPKTRLVGLSPEDPYQYSPQFLLLPRLAISLTESYATIRLVWFGIQTTLFLGVAALLALWVGGRAGAVAALLLPLVLAAFPALYSLQFGQVHLAAISLGVAGLIALEKRRRALGGALLAISILAKIFPLVLLLPLVGQRRWRDLGAVLAFGIAITLLALAVLGPAPFVAFFDYQIPRLASGEAFAFGEAWPEVRELMIADNQGAFGFIVKLGEIGVPGMNEQTAIVWSRVFGLLVLTSGLLIGGTLERSSRLDRVVVWLALLGLGSLTSTGAFGDYVPVTATWICTFLALRMIEDRRLLLPLAVVWVLQFFILGAIPLGAYSDSVVMIPLSALGAMALFGLYVWIFIDVMRRNRKVVGEGRQKLDLQLSAPMG